MAAAASPVTPTPLAVTTATRPRCNPEAFFHELSTQTHRTLTILERHLRDQLHETEGFLDLHPKSKAKRISGVITYLALPAIIGIGAGFAPETTLSFSILGAAAAANCSLLLNTYDKLTLKDWTCLIIKGLIGLMLALIMNLGLKHRVLPTIMIGFCCAMLAQQFQHLNRRRREERLVPKASAITTALLLDTSAVLSSWGALFYLNPSAIEAEPIIVATRPFWAATYALLLLTIISSTLKNHLAETHTRKQIQRIVNYIFGSLMQANTIASIFFLIAQFALRERSSTTTTLTLMSNILIGIAALASLIISYWTLPGNLTLYAEYLKHIQNTDTHSSTTAMPPKPVTNGNCCKEIGKIILKGYLYIGSSVSALIQLRNLLGFVYSDLRDERITLAMNIIGVSLGLLGASYALFAASRRDRSSLPAYVYTAGNILNKANQTISITATTAYSLSFAYGILALIYDTPLHVLLQNGQLPASHIIAGIILIGALSHALAAKNLSRVIKKESNGRSAVDVELIGHASQKFAANVANTTTTAIVSPLRQILTTNKTPTDKATAIPAETTHTATALEISATIAAEPTAVIKKNPLTVAAEGGSTP